MNGKTTKPRWSVSVFNRAGKAHLWEVSPLKPKYSRSHCGLVETNDNLPEKEYVCLSVCKVCEKRETQQNKP